MFFTLILWRSPQYAAAREFGGAEWFAAPPLRSAAAQSLLASNILRKPFITGPPTAIESVVPDGSRFSRMRGSNRRLVSDGSVVGAKNLSELVGRRRRKKDRFKVSKYNFYYMHDGFK